MPRYNIIPVKAIRFIILLFHRCCFVCSKFFISHTKWMNTPHDGWMNGWMNITNDNDEEQNITKQKKLCRREKIDELHQRLRDQVDWRVSFVTDSSSRLSEMPCNNLKLLRIYPFFDVWCRLDAQEGLCCVQRLQPELLQFITHHSAHIVTTLLSVAHVYESYGWWILSLNIFSAYFWLCFPLRLRGCLV